MEAYVGIKQAYPGRTRVHPTRVPVLIFPYQGLLVPT